MKCRIDKEVCAVDKDKRRIRGKARDDGVDRSGAAHDGGTSVALTNKKRESLYDNTYREQLLWQG
jgi:hypothetical protein